MHLPLPKRLISLYAPPRIVQDRDAHTVGPQSMRDEHERRDLQAVLERAQRHAQDSQWCIANASLKASLHL